MNENKEVFRSPHLSLSCKLRPGAIVAATCTLAVRISLGDLDVGCVAPTGPNNSKCHEALLFGMLVNGK